MLQTPEFPHALSRRPASPRLRLHDNIAADELAIKRLKKRKLQLKDTIHRLESALIPDEPA